MLHETSGSATGIFSVEGIDINNSGEVAIGANITPDNPPNTGLLYDTSAIVQYNPDGATPGDALLPFAST